MTQPIYQYLYTALHCHCFWMLLRNARCFSPWMANLNSVHGWEKPIVQPWPQSAKNIRDKAVLSPTRMCGTQVTAGQTLLHGEWAQQSPLGVTRSQIHLYGRACRKGWWRTSHTVFTPAIGNCGSTCPNYKCKHLPETWWQIDFFFFFFARTKPQQTWKKVPTNLSTYSTFLLHSGEQIQLKLRNHNPQPVHSLWPLSPSIHFAFRANCTVNPSYQHLGRNREQAIYFRPMATAAPREAAPTLCILIIGTD